MLRAWRAFANCSDVFANLHRQIVYMVGIQRIILDDAAALGKRRVDTTKQKDGGHDRIRVAIRSSQLRDLPERPPFIDNPDCDYGERHDHPILHWKVSPDISYKPIRHLAPQGGRLRL